MLLSSWLTYNEFYIHQWFLDVSVDVYWRLTTSLKIVFWYKAEGLMKVVNSLKSAKKRHKNCQIVKRRGRAFVINKTNPRFKARQG